MTTNKQQHQLQTLSLLAFCRVKIDPSTVNMVLVLDVGVEAVLIAPSGSAGETGSEEQLDCRVRLREIKAADENFYSL